MQLEPPVRASRLAPLAPQHEEGCVPAIKMNNVQPNRRASALKPLFVLALLTVAAVLSAGALARRAAADDALAALRAAFARPAAIPAPPGNPVTPQKVDLGRDAVYGHAPVRRRHHGLRHLPRSGSVLLRRRRAQAGPRRRAPAAAHAVAVESRLGPDLLLGRARAEPRGAGERADREPPRDGRRHRQGGGAPCRRSCHGGALCRGVPGRSARHRGPHPRRARELRAHPRLAEDPLRPLARGRRGGPRRRRSAQASRSSSARRAASPATRAGASPTRPSTTSACPAPTADAARS